MAVLGGGGGAMAANGGGERAAGVVELGGGVAGGGGAWVGSEGGSGGVPEVCTPSTVAPVYLLTSHSGGPGLRRLTANCCARAAWATEAKATLTPTTRSVASRVRRLAACSVMPVMVTSGRGSARAQCEAAG